MTSSRLPGKVLMPVGGRPALEVMIERVGRARQIDQVVVATTVNDSDEPIVELARRLGVGCFRGSEEDVLARVLGAARAYEADYIVELTGDCTLMDPALIDDCVAAHRNSDAAYVYNVTKEPPPSYPPGMDVQVFATALLAESDRLTDDPDDREHVSLYIRERPDTYRHLLVQAPPDLRWPDQFITLDTESDLQMIRQIYDALAVDNPLFGIREITAYLRANPQVAALNSRVVHRLIHVNDQLWRKE